MTTALERLESILDEKEAEIATLQRQLEAFEHEKQERVWSWTKHQTISEHNDPSLPVPRLEIIFNKRGDTWYNSECWYRMVYRHFLGHLIGIPLGFTERNGGDGKPPIYDGKIDLPFRGGAHIKHDAKTLKLPAYAICDGVVNELYNPANTEE